MTEKQRKRNRRALLRAILAEDLRAMWERVHPHRPGEPAFLSAADLIFEIDRHWDEFVPEIRMWCFETVGP